MSQPEALKFLFQRFPPSTAARVLHEKIFRHPSVRERRFALDRLDSVAEESLEKAHARFEREAVRLSVRALSAALKKAELPAHRLDFLAVTTCTAYLCPGLSSHTAERAGLRPDVVRMDLVGMGCAAALPALEAAGNFLAAHPGATAAVVCAELGSAAFFPGDAPDLIVSNALFGDGAAAAVLGAGRGPRFKKFVSLHAPRWREEIRFRWEKDRLRNVLSPRVPHRAAEGVMKIVASLLGKKHPSSIRHWALHPGGAKILDALRESLDLPAKTLAPARAVLRRTGNLSSPSCLFVLDEILRRRRPQRGEKGVLASFGAGFSAHAALLEF